MAQFGGPISPSELAEKTSSTIIIIIIQQNIKICLAHCKIELQNELVAINPRFDKLITALTSPVNKREH